MQKRIRSIRIQSIIELNPENFNVKNRFFQDNSQNLRYFCSTLLELSRIYILVFLFQEKMDNNKEMMKLMGFSSFGTPPNMKDYENENENGFSRSLSPFSTSEERIVRRRSRSHSRSRRSRSRSRSRSREKKSKKRSRSRSRSHSRSKKSKKNRSRSRERRRSRSGSPEEKRHRKSK